MVRYSEPVVVNHVVLCRTSGFVSWCVLMSQWLCVMVFYTELVVVNCVVLYGVCESQCADQLVVNHFVLC